MVLIVVNGVYRWIYGHCTRRCLVGRTVLRWVQRTACPDTLLARPGRREIAGFIGKIWDLFIFYTTAPKRSVICLLMYIVHFCPPPFRAVWYCSFELHGSQVRILYHPEWHRLLNLSKWQKYDQILMKFCNVQTKTFLIILSLFSK